MSSDPFAIALVLTIVGLFIIVLLLLVTYIKGYDRGWADHKEMCHRYHISPEPPEGAPKIPAPPLPPPPHQYGRHKL